MFAFAVTFRNARGQLCVFDVDTDGDDAARFAAAVAANADYADVRVTAVELPELDPETSKRITERIARSIRARALLDSLDVYR